MSIDFNEKINSRLSYVLHMCIIHVYLYCNVSPGDRGSIPKTQKMVLDAALLNTQHYKVRIKDKVEQSRERSGTLPNTLVW